MLKIFMAALLLFFPFPLKGLANVPTDTSSIKAAFIRDGNLWTLINNKEEQVTKTGKVFDPAWSYDGKLISYYHQTPSDIPNEITQDEIWVYNVETKQNEKIIRNGYSAQWAPNKDVIAYKNHDSLLNVSNVEHFYNVALGVYGFTWFPDGSGFLLASRADQLPDGLTSPILYKKQIGSNLSDINLDKGAKRFFTLPNEVGIEGKKVLSIEVGYFKFSSSGKWISFIVSPYASWSMDSNMLCVLSSDGKDFKVLDEVILGVSKPKWAPNKDILAFIAGGGRLVTGFKDKKLKWRELPANGTLTPSNYAELDFTWVDDEHLVTSRVKEKEWSNDPKMHPLPSLYIINLTNQKETNIIKPPQGFGDFHPQYVESLHKLIWLRGSSIFDQHRTVWISDPAGSHPHAWLKNVDDIEFFQP